MLCGVENERKSFEDWEGKFGGLENVSGEIIWELKFKFFEVMRLDKLASKWIEKNSSFECFWVL